MDLVVLAGGKGRRMGKTKASLELNGTSLIEIVVERLRPLFDRVVVSTADGGSFPGTDAIAVADTYRDCGALGGLHAGLAAATSSRVFAVACDMPFVNPQLVKMLMSRSEDYDVVVPSTAPDKLEPLHAVYSKTCLPHMEKLLKQKNLRIFDFFDRVKVDYVGVDEILSVDPGMLSFFNINTPDDLVRAHQLLTEE